MGAAVEAAGWAAEVADNDADKWTASWPAVELEDGADGKGSCDDPDGCGAGCDSSCSAGCKAG